MGLAVGLSGAALTLWCSLAAQMPEGQKGLFFGVLPISRGGRVLVSGADFAKWLGASWKLEEGRFVAGDDLARPRLVVWAGKREAVVRGRRVLMDAKAEVVRGAIMVPLRALADAFGVWVKVERRTIGVVVPQAGKAAQFAMPPAEGSLEWKMWRVVEKWFGLGGGRRDVWELLSRRRQQVLLAKAGSGAAEAFRSIWAGRAAEAMNIVESRVSGRSGAVVVAVKFRGGGAAVYAMNLVLQRDGWRVERIEEVAADSGLVRAEGSEVQQGP